MEQPIKFEALISYNAATSVGPAHSIRRKKATLQFFAPDAPTARAYATSRADYPDAVLLSCYALPLFMGSVIAGDDDNELGLVL